MLHPSTLRGRSLINIRIRILRLSASIQSLETEIFRLPNNRDDPKALQTQNKGDD